MTADELATLRVAELLLDPTPDAAVAVLRAVEAAPESSRRLALDRLDAFLRSQPEARPRPVVDAVVALRRAGLS